MDITAILIFLVALLPRIHMASQVGMTWDEGVYILGGGLTIKNILSRNFSEKAWSFELHPPFIMYFFGISLGLYSLIKSVLKYGYKVNLVKITNEAIASFSGRNALAAIRLPNVIFGSLTCVLVYYIGYDILGSRELGILAALILAWLPAFISWTSLAMLEGGVSFFFALTIWSLLKASDQGTFDVTYVLISGIALGMAFASREFGYFIPAVVLPWFIAKLISGGYLHIIESAAVLLLWAFVGCVVFYILWPFLWKNPVRQFLKTFRNISHMKSNPKWNFFIINFLSTSPIVIILLAGAGAVNTLTSRIDSPMFMVLSWFLVPAAIMSLPPFPKRGGVYEMSFVMPAFSLLAALGMLEVYNIVNNIPSSSILLILPLIWLVFSNLNIAPYYMDYYNTYGKKLLEHKEFGVVPFGWWGEGMDAAMEYLDRNASQNATVWVYGPKATALYHSKRANLIKTTGKVVFYELRKMSGTNVEIGDETYSWRNGDINICLPYYNKDGLHELTLDKLKREYGVDYVVIYKWALNNISLTGLSKNHYNLVHSLRKEKNPVFVSRIKNTEVCWVYKL